MADLKCEYTDIKNVKHQVEHQLIPSDSKDSREQIMEELLTALTRAGKRTPA